MEPGGGESVPPRDGSWAALLGIASTRYSR